ncbi:MAG: YqaJ viral recombinase family protein [Bacteroidales bacterium]|nr:YqaJ viral recombinase family protein [Bacteroidales bacterium]
MNIIEIEQGSDDWKRMREGRLTGTKIGSIYAKSRKQDEIFDTSKHLLGFYELLAERLTDCDDLSSNAERGKELESEALEVASDELGIDFVRGNVWELDKNHIESPDGYTNDLKMAIEIKCLSSARHIQAIYDDVPPQEYATEYANYFLVNKDLEMLIVFLYDPRFIEQKLRTHYWFLNRVDLMPQIKALKQVKKQVLRELKEAAERLAQ